MLTEVSKKSQNSDYFFYEKTELNTSIYLSRQRYFSKFLKTPMKVLCLVFIEVGFANNEGQSVFRKNKKINPLSLFLMLLGAVIFQSCIPSAITARLGSSTQKQNTSIDDVFIAPNSNSGRASLSATAVCTDKIIIAKEYKYTLADRYFITTRDNDQQIVETGVLKNYFRATGVLFNFYENQVVGSSALCRFYIPATKTHFYTADTAECNQLKINLI